MPRVPGSRSFTVCRQKRDIAAREAAGCYVCLVRALDEQDDRTRSGGTERHSRSSQDTETVTSQTESVTAVTCCNKEHSCPVTYSIYRCESYGHRITRASSMEPSSHPGHSLEHYTCSEWTTMPQQSYRYANLTAESSPSGSLVLLQSNPFTLI